MEAGVAEEDLLLRRLSDSRHRFQRRMQQLIEKYSQPFEDDPLVQMATLTYETSQGLRIWGGKLIKERKKKTIQVFSAKLYNVDTGLWAVSGSSSVLRSSELLLLQDMPQATLMGKNQGRPGGVQDCFFLPLSVENRFHCPRPPPPPPPGARQPGSPVEVVNQIEGLVPAGPGGSECPPYHRSQALRTESEDSDTAASSDTETEDPFASASVPAMPRSPLKDELRRKYLTQGDLLLQGAEGAQGVDSGEDLLVTRTPSLALPAAPSLEHCGGGSAVSPGDLAQLASSTGNDSVLLLGTSSDSYLSSQSFQADDICNVTISDLYAGMLHSMSRLLSTKPGSIISTKTTILQAWRRRPRRSRVPWREMGSHGDRRFRRSPRERASLSLEPRKETGALRDCKNIPHVARHEMGLTSKNSFLERSKHQVCRFNPTRKELQEPSLASVDFSSMHRKLRGQEDRLRALMWLISPVKIVSRPRLLQGLQENRYREIEVQFNKLHRECLPSPRKLLPLASPLASQAVDVYRGGSVNPAGPHRLSLPTSQARARGLSEAFGNTSRSAEADSSPRSDISPFSEVHPFQSPDHSWRTADLFPRSSSRTLSEAMSPLKTSSTPPRRPLGSGKSRYNEIKEQFDKLHQKCCQVSPQQANVPPCTGVPLGNAGAKVQHHHTGDLGTSGVGSRFPSFQKLKVSPQRCLESPWGPVAATARASAFTTRDSTDHTPLPTKRRRLSYPNVEPQDSRGAGPPSQCSWEKNTSLQMEEKSDFT
ncbi:Holliday junction recognition protein [Thomomys bottae]